ncbi:unnamed protein product [Dovyalis caffra]|uniref:Uncharacterized protein n=1 Tax=Dovyalis caffra TaxID=77055 RepID=A0AAV1SKJ9_9ROSI|nr:unnamed protein product [Dovyalis caffra]
MCSSYNTHSSGGGGRGSDSGGYGVDSTCSKKVKKQKVPKRGPGVAELEKILRDQEKKDTNLDKTKNIEGFSVVSQVSSSYQRQSPILPSQKSQPKNLSSTPDPNPFSTPPSTTFCGNCSNNTSLQVCRGGNGGSGIVLHEHGFLPTMWKSCQPNVDIGGPRLASGIPFSVRSTNGLSQLFPSSSWTQRSQYSPTQTLNFFPESVEPPPSSTTPSSVVMYQGIEPPSNQTSDHHYHSVWPEEDKANEKIGSKRNTDYGVAKGNFLLFGSPTIPSPSSHLSQQEQSNSKHPLPFQESIEDSPHRPGRGSESICNKPSFSFLFPVEQKSKEEINFSLNNDGIDLDLRL